MKCKLAIVFVFLALTLFCGVSAFAASWQAYQLPDGEICVTDEALDYEPLTALTLGLGETRSIDVRTASEHRFESSSRYIRVDENGVLSSESTGRAEVRIYYTSKSFVEIKVTVLKAPGLIRLNHSSVTMNPGQRATLKYTLSRDSAGLVTFTSSDTNIVSINDKGEMYAIIPGKVQITAETYNGRTAECSVIVQAPPAAKIESADSYVGYAHERFHLDAKLNGGFNETLSYECLNPDICEVKSDGTVYCLKEGIALVNLIASGGNRTSCKINVLPPASGIKPDKNKIFLYVGGAAQISATPIGGGGYYYVESLSPELVVTEGETGIRAVKSGKAKVRISVYEGVSCEMEVDVLPFPTECTLTVPGTLIAVGESMSCSVAGEYTAAMPFTLESSDDKVLRVDTNGLVTAVSKGRAYLYATSGGYRQSVEITVEQMSRNISFDKKDYALGVGDSVKLSLNYKDGTGKATYASTNEAVASVDQNGTIRALAPGEATVSAKLLNNTTANATVTVYPAAKNLYSDFDSVTIGRGDSLRINFTFDEGCLSVIHYQSEDESIISSSDDGTVRSLDVPGSAYVNASTVAGASRRILVNVIAAPSDMHLNTERLTQEGLFTDYLRLNVGSEYDLGVAFDGYSLVSYSCLSLDEEYVSVTNGGVVTALKSGTARIRVRTYNGYERNILVEIV